MSREVRRVPLDFDFPLGKTWTGYLLPDDQLGFWAVTVGTNMARATPLLGTEGPFGPQLNMTPFNAANRPASVLAAATDTCWPRIARTASSNPSNAPGTLRPG